MSGELTEIYIRQEQYEPLSRLMANAIAGTRFPVSANDARGLYYTRRDDIEIKTPACLILLSATEYDEAHVATLDTVRVITLRRSPTSGPGWWRIVA